MAFRIAHISDTHLSGAKPSFAANFLKVANQISSGGADLVLNSSDMSLDGSAQESDLLEARRLHATLALPRRFIPGNHDIGESQDAPASRGLPVLSAATRRCYLRHFGADYWCLHVPGWRILPLMTSCWAATLRPPMSRSALCTRCLDGRAGGSGAVYT